MFLKWLQARLSESTSWRGIAAFFASAGTALAGAAFPRAGLVVVAIGAVGALITKEKVTYRCGGAGSQPQPRKPQRDAFARPVRDQPIACLKIVSSGPRPAQHPASWPSMTTLGRLRIPCCFAVAATCA